jgi:hypothetical protein
VAAPLAPAAIERVDVAQAKDDAADSVAEAPTLDVARDVETALPIADGENEKEQTSAEPATLAPRAEMVPLPPTPAKRVSGTDDEEGLQTLKMPDTPETPAKAVPAAGPGAGVEPVTPQGKDKAAEEEVGRLAWCTEHQAAQ